MSDSGYPYYDEGRQRRDPAPLHQYDDRALRNLNRANDPFATRRPDIFTRDRLERERFGPERRAREDLFTPPVIMVHEPEERRRSSVPALECAGPFPGFARYSQTPPPRASRRRVDPFADMFGDVERPERAHREERLRMDPFGPPNPFVSHRRERERDRPSSRDTFEPYGGFGEPRNPFAPGGRRYDDGFNLQPRRDSDERFGEEERRRRDHYRARAGEPWGLAGYNEYEERRRYGL